jgi:NTE family protein
MLHRSTEDMQLWKPKIGLALGSGAARGWAHIGILHGLKKHGIEPDIVVGSSIGALVGGVYLAGALVALEEWACSLNRRRIIAMLDFKMHTGGLIGGGRLAAKLERHLGDMRIEDLPRPFVAVASDLINGHELWLREGRLVDALQASYALPGIFPAVHLNHHWMVDGALVNPVPVSVCNALGADLTIAVNLQGDFLGKVKRPTNKVSPSPPAFDLLDGTGGAVPEIKIRSGRHSSHGFFRRQSGHPSLVGTMVSSLSILQDRLARSRLAADPPDILIEPRVGQVGLLEFDHAAELIAEGEAAVERALPKIKDVLDSVVATSR